MTVPMSILMCTWHANMATRPMTYNKFWEIFRMFVSDSTWFRDRSVLCYLGTQLEGFRQNWCVRYWTPFQVDQDIQRKGKCLMHLKIQMFLWRTTFVRSTILDWITSKLTEIVGGSFIHLILTISWSRRFVECRSSLVENELMHKDSYPTYQYWLKVYLNGLKKVRLK